MSEVIDEIEALLPWYAAGALSAPERAKVEAALRERPELRASLATLEEDCGETIALNEALGAPSPDVWARIAKGAASAPPKLSLGGRVALWFGFEDGPSTRLAWAGGLAALIIALQAATIVGVLRSGGGAKPSFSTADIGGAHGEALIAFRDAATLGDVTAFLRASHATIVAGPRAGGLYDLDFDPKPADKAELDALLKTLSASPLVKAALPGTGS